MELGRCPGLTNQDPDHREGDEQPPFTRLVGVHPEHVVRVETFPFTVSSGIAAPVREGAMTRRDRRSRMNRFLSVVRSMTDKIIELSRGVVTARSYGESKRAVGVGQVNMVMVMTRE